LEVSSKQIGNLSTKATFGIYRVFAVKPVKESLDVQLIVLNCAVDTALGSLDFGEVAAS